MARKVKVRDYNQPGVVSRGSPWMNSKHVKLATQIRRTSGNSKALAYEACVSIESDGRSKHRRIADDRQACAHGPAPRRALGLALKKLGGIITRRSSAFRGHN